MRYYIVDDSIAVVRILQNIIVTRGLGEVAGSATDPELAVDEIVKIRPDVVLVDLLMGGIDGITLVQRVKEKLPDMPAVMISKVGDKAMVQSSYEAGIEFFIQKPINVIEVEKVLRGLEEKIRIKEIVISIRDILPQEESAPDAGASSGEGGRDVLAGSNHISVFLGMLGMLGEKGARDIQEMARLMILSGRSFDRSILEEAASVMADTSRNVEQRARRAIKKGLTNTANAVLNDYAGDIVEDYAGYVFDFTAIKEEMSAVEGKGNPGGGRVSLPRFMDGLVTYYHTVK